MNNITILKLIIIFFLGLTARKEKEVEIQTKKAQLDEIHKEKEAKRLIKEEREKVETAALGGFQLLDLIITELKSQMTC